MNTSNNLKAAKKNLNGAASIELSTEYLDGHLQHGTFWRTITTYTISLVKT
jgi:hypothetical protein